MTTQSEPVLVLDGIHYSIGAARILTDVSLQVAPGELVCLIGPNGAGKTTLINVMTGNVRPSTGSVHLQGRDVTRSPSNVRSKVGLGRTFQTSYLLEALSVLDNVTLGSLGPKHVGLRALLRPRRSEGSAESELRGIIASVGLAGREHVPVRSLSHAERRKVELAIAVAGSSSVLLLDEPMSGVSAEDVPELVALIRGLRAAGTSIVLVEHHMDVVLELADRIVVLHHGEVMADGTPDEVMNNKEVQTAYMGEEL